MNQFEIQCQGIDCKIQFSSPDVEEWMTTEITVKVPNFEGSFTCTVQVSELDYLLELFSKLELSIGQCSSAQWSNMEENIEFKMELAKLGGLYCSYKFCPSNSEFAPTLSGHFEADQTYITHWQKQLTEIINKMKKQLTKPFTGPA